MLAPNDVTIRLQLGLASNPPAFPVDLNTGQAPACWRGGTLIVDVAVFDAAGAPVDLSDLVFLEFDIFPVPGNNQTPGSGFNYNPYSVSPYPNLPPAPLLFQSVAQDDIDSDVSLDEFRAGNARQAQAVFDWVQTMQLELDGRASRLFWLVIHGQTSANRRPVYGGAPLLVYASGATGIYMPNNLAPILVPEETILYVGPNQQMPFSLPITVDGQVVVDGGTLVQT